MQPFDALTIKAVLQEAKPLLLNRRVDKIYQLGRDELVLTLRAKAGMINLFMSAHSAHGRICLVKLPSGNSNAAPSDRDKSLSRYLPVLKPGQSANNFAAASGFMTTLRKHLAGASLVGVEQPVGERVVNFVFSCTDEVGTASLKVLSAEIMGRHSNLIFWDKASEKILGASHLVTKEMSRQREILPGLQYVRPPVPEKSSVFTAGKEDFLKHLADLQKRLEGTAGSDASASTTDGATQAAQSADAEESVTPAAVPATSPDDPSAASADEAQGPALVSPAPSSPAPSPSSPAPSSPSLPPRAQSPTAQSPTAGGGKAAPSSPSSTAGHAPGQPRGLNVIPPTVEQWLIDIYTGLGRHLAEELVNHAKLPSKITKETFDAAALKEALWPELLAIQQATAFKACMKTDLSRYTVLGWFEDLADESKWKQFPAVNDMVEEYFRLIEAREQFHQLRERLRSEIKTESEKLQTRLSAADQHLVSTEDPTEFKKWGDLVLANLNTIEAGQQILTCDDLYSLESLDSLGGSNKKQIEIKLNPNMNASQNAQNFYRQFAKTRARQSAASMSRIEATNKLSSLQKQMDALEQAKGTDELRVLRDILMPRKLENKRVAPPEPQNKKPKQRLLQLNSSDNWTIYVGRNRHENDHLLTRLAQPSDIWLHILGQGGAHVLIRVPASKQDPPMTTLKEAALLAARLSKTAPGTKVRVVYTQVRFVKKVAKDKPGLVRYENEKTIEVDTSQPVPQYMKHVFAHDAR